MLVLMHCCHCLEILNNFWIAVLHFHFVHCLQITYTDLPIAIKPGTPYHLLWLFSFSFEDFSLSPEYRPCQESSPPLDSITLQPQSKFILLGSADRPNLASTVLFWRAALFTTCPYVNLTASRFLIAGGKIAFLMPKSR